MSNYVKTTNFAVKDGLVTGNPAKVVNGTELDSEFNNIATAISTKANTASPTFTGTATIPTVDINAGAIDGTAIGAASASTGNFTTLSINGTAITSTAAELNVLDGLTATLTELNYVAGVTSAIQTQFSAKAPLASPTFTGTATLPTVDINAGAIDGTAIGDTSRSTGKFTTLSANTSLALASGATVTAILSENAMTSNSATALATQQSIKAYADSLAFASQSLPVVLGIGNSTGANNIIVTAGQSITTNTVAETTLAAGVTVDGVLLKDGGAVIASGQALTTNTISETTAASGVTVDGLLIKDGGATLAGAINESRATVASHATTADIWSALGNQIDWTGTATTTAFPAAPQAGSQRRLICAAACSFTAGANMLIAGVTSGSTVTCAANDIVIVDAVTTTQFKLTRIKYDGTAQVGSDLTLLATATASSVAAVDFTSVITSAYDEYLCEFINVVPASAAAFYLRTSADNGSTFDAAAGNYKYATIYNDSAAAGVAVSNTASITFIGLSGNYNVSNTASDGGISGYARIYNPSNTTMIKHLPFTSSFASGATVASVTGSGVRAAIAAVNAVRFLFAAGNISSGMFKIYGVKK